MGIDAKIVLAEVFLVLARYRFTSKLFGDMQISDKERHAAQQACDARNIVRTLWWVFAPSSFFFPLRFSCFADAESTAMAAIAAAAASAAVLDIAAACESGSEHPVGRAMVDAAAVAERTYAAATAAAAVVGERIAGGGTARRPFERRDQAESGSECPSSEDSNSDSFGLFESATAGATKTKDVALASSSNGARKRRLSKTEPQPMGTVPENDAHAAPGSAVTDFVSEPGRGVACQHPLGRVCVGTRAWGETNGGRRKAVEGQGDATMTQADAVMRELEEAGKTAVMVTLDGEAVGVVAVADTDKEVCSCRFCSGFSKDSFSLLLLRLRVRQTNLERFVFTCARKRVLARAHFSIFVPFACRLPLSVCPCVMSVEMSPGLRFKVVESLPCPI